MKPLTLVRAINDQTRGGTRMALTLETHGEAMRTLARLANVPDSLVETFFAPGAGRIVRRDLGIHRMSFVLPRGADVLRLTADRTDGGATFAAIKDGNLSGERPDGLTTRAEALAIGDPWGGAADPALPIVHVFSNHRIWDAYLQVVRAGIGEEAHGRTVRAYRAPGRTVVDPATLLPSTTDLQPVGEDALPGAHQIQVLAEIGKETEGAPVRIYGRKLMPPRDPDADGLYVSFELEKNQWVEQVEGIAGVLNRAHKSGTGFGRLLVNGMTAPWDGRPSDFFTSIETAEREMIGRLKARLAADVEVVWMFGWTFAEKLQAIRGARFAVAPIGSASLIANALEIPGVTYSNRERIGWSRWIDHAAMVRVPAELLNDRTEVAGLREPRVARRVPRVSYSIRPAEFVPFAMRHFRDTVAPAAIRAG